MNNRIIDTLINSTEKTKKSYLVFGSAAVILMISLVTVIIYKLGGTGTAITHLMYIPIIISVFVLGIKGGVASAVAAGLALGPFMPRDVQNGIMQSPYSWIFRMSMFNIIVLLVGLLAGRIRRTEELEKAKAYESIIEGYPNFYKLKHDLTKLTSIDDETTFTLVLFNFTNRQMVDRYVNYDIGLKAMTDLLKKAVDFFSEGIVYCVDTEKFIVVLPETNIENAVEMSESFCSENKRPIYIENLPVSVKLKSGIINYPESGTDLNVVLMNLDKALGYACRVQNDIVIYNEKLSSENSRYYNEIVSLYDALQKNKFMLVYQPKINIKNDGLEGVEALLRWNDSMHKDMSIEKLIKLAEDAGFIGEITRWVVKNTIKQIKIWNEKGISIKISINLSSIDLSDESFLFFFKDSMETNGISPDLIEFELTERAIFSDDKSMTYLLNKIKKYGMKISLDDYGTGYNSMKSFISFSSMFDYLKIDKVFIDNIANPDNYELVSNIILCANKMGMKVIAEGIETEEQFRILREMGCDIVQGYYYSRPLPPEEIESFILNYGNSSCSAACDI